MDIESIIAKIKEILNDQGGYFIANSLNPPANDNEISHLEQAIGVEIPNEFKLFLTVHNGQSGKKRFCEDGGLHTINQIIIENKGINDLNNAYEISGWKKTFLPFTDGNGGDCLLLDPESNAVYKFWNDDGEVERIHDSFSEWLMSVLNTFQSGHFGFYDENLDFWEYE